MQKTMKSIKQLRSQAKNKRKSVEKKGQTEVEETPKDKSKRNKILEQKNQKNATDIITSVLSGLISEDNISELQQMHQNSEPYTHLVLYNLYDDIKMRKLANEAKENMNCTFKETGNASISFLAYSIVTQYHGCSNVSNADLFKLYQTPDLSNLTAEGSNMPQLIKLRSAIYSPVFRNFVERVTGCRKLTGCFPHRITCFYF